MTPRSLFTIVLKIIGILFIKDILEAIPQLIATMVQMVSSYSVADGILPFIFIFISLSIYILVAYWFIFKTDFLIEKLKLDKNFLQENFSLNIHRSTVLSIAIIIIGGLLIADNIPLLCRSVYFYFENRSVRSYEKNPDYSYIILYTVEILIGLILTGNHLLFVNFIEKKKRKTSATLTQDN